MTLGKGRIVEPGIDWYLDLSIRTKKSKCLLLRCHKQKRVFHLLSFAPATSESCTKTGVLMRQVQYMLRKRCRLDDAPDFDGAFFFNQVPNDVKQRWRELYTFVSNFLTEEARHPTSLPPSTTCIAKR
jgi:hypothetical protein